MRVLYVSRGAIGALVTGTRLVADTLTSVRPKAAELAGKRPETRNPSQSVGWPNAAYLAVSLAVFLH